MKYFSLWMIENFTKRTGKTTLCWDCILAFGKMKCCVSLTWLFWCTSFSDKAWIKTDGQTATTKCRKRIDKSIHAHKTRRVNTRIQMHSRKPYVCCCCICYVRAIREFNNKRQRSFARTHTSTYHFISSHSLYAQRMPSPTTTIPVLTYCKRKQMLNTLISVAMLPTQSLYVAPTHAHTRACVHTISFAVQVCVRISFEMMIAQHTLFVCVFAVSDFAPVFVSVHTCVCWALLWCNLLHVF